MYPSDTYSEEEAHYFMDKCLEESRRSYENGEVPVGCLFLDRRTKTVLTVASNRTNVDKNACRHAELVAYRQILGTLNTDEEWHAVAPHIDVWVSCEPCIMCSAALKTLGIRRCIYGCGNARFGGCGTALPIHSLRSNPYADLECYKGLKEAEAIAILQVFYERGNVYAPDEKRKRPLKDDSALHMTPNDSLSFPNEP